LRSRPFPGNLIQKLPPFVRDLDRRVEIGRFFFQIPDLEQSGRTFGDEARGFLDDCLTVVTDYQTD